MPDSMDSALRQSVTGFGAFGLRRLMLYRAGVSTPVPTVNLFRIGRSSIAPCRRNARVTFVGEIIVDGHALIMDPAAAPRKWAWIG